MSYEDNYNWWGGGREGYTYSEYAKNYPEDEEGWVKTDTSGYYGSGLDPKIDSITTNNKAPYDRPIDKTQHWDVVKDEESLYNAMRGADKEMSDFYNGKSKYKKADGSN